MHQQQMGFEESKRFIREKKDFYNALERNGYVCPDVDSRFTTGDVLLAIREKKMYCPTYEDLKRRPCPDPPTDIVIRDELVSLVKSGLHNIDAQNRPMFQKLIKELERVPANKQWMLDVVATLTHGNHAFFSKNFVPPPKVKPQSLNSVVINNADGFFSGLPESKSKKSKGYRVMVDPLQREQQKLQLLEEQELKKRNALQAQRDLIAQMQQVNLNAQQNQNPQHFGFNQANGAQQPVVNPFQTNIAQPGQPQYEEVKSLESSFRHFGRDLSNSVSPTRGMDSTTLLVKQRNQKRKDRAAQAKNNGLPNTITTVDEDEDLENTLDEMAAR